MHESLRKKRPRDIFCAKNATPPTRVNRESKRESKRERVKEREREKHDRHRRTKIKIFELFFDAFLFFFSERRQ